MLVTGVANGRYQGILSVSTHIWRCSLKQMHQRINKSCKDFNFTDRFVYNYLNLGYEISPKLLILS